MNHHLNMPSYRPMQPLRPFPMVNINSLKPGDPVWRTLDGVLFLTHHGCFAGFDFWGIPWVFEHSKGARSQLVPFEKFSKGFQVYFKPILDVNRPAAIARMRELLARPKEYDELQFNCEHAKNYITTGTAYSPQAAIALAAIGLGIYVAIKKVA